MSFIKIANAIELDGYEFSFMEIWYFIVSSKINHSITIISIRCYYFIVEKHSFFNAFVKNVMIYHKAKIYDEIS